MEVENELPLELVLRAAVRNSGMSLRTVAREAGVGQPLLSRFLSGKTITLNSAARLFEYFHFEAVQRQVSPSQDDTLPEPPLAASTARNTKKPAKN